MAGLKLAFLRPATGGVSRTSEGEQRGHRPFPLPSSDGSRESDHEARGVRAPSCSMPPAFEAGDGNKGKQRTFWSYPARLLLPQTPSTGDDDGGTGRSFASVPSSLAGRNIAPCESCFFRHHAIEKPSSGSPFCCLFYPSILQFMLVIDRLYTSTSFLRPMSIPTLLAGAARFERGVTHPGDLCKRRTQK